MTPEALIRDLDEVAAALPYAVDDYEAANETFRRWRELGARKDYDLVLTWVYCYARRYITIKFIKFSRLDSTDLETLISLTFRRSQSKLHTIRDPDRFASFVSVICKNTFLNHLRTLDRRSEIEDFDRLPAEENPSEHRAESIDRSVIRYALTRAIARLPITLRTTAHLRFTENLDYDAIAERTGWPIATIRSYASKAIHRLRMDPALVDFYKEYTEGEK